MSTVPYPAELKLMLNSVFQKDGMNAALERVHEEFPKYRKRLTKVRAYAVCQVFRKKAAAEESAEKIPWVSLSDADREKVEAAARKLRADHVRWSAIVEQLGAKFPQVEVPAPMNLARILGKGNHNQKPGKLKTAKHLVLAIRNAGSLNFEAEISPEQALRVIGECLA